MYYQQPTLATLQNMEANHNEGCDSISPCIADSKSISLSPSFLATQREPYVRPVPRFVYDSTSYNPTVNLREPFDQPVGGSCYETSLSPFTATPREPSKPLDPRLLTSFETNYAADRAPNTKPQAQHPLDKVSVNHRPNSSMSIFSFEQPPRDSRYYAQALSIRDKLALSRGEKNHNLQEWSGRSLVTHHEARKDLVPRVMPKVEQSNALASIEHDKQHSQRFLSQLTEKVRKIFGLPRIKVDGVKKDESTCAQSRRASQSTFDPHSSTLSPLKPPPLPESKSTPSFQEFVNNTPYYNVSHTRATSSGDYFSQPSGPRRSTYNVRHISSLASTPAPSSFSDSSPHVPSPLAREVQFRANPEITFDSLLAPHKSGRGEVLKDSKYAQKVQTPTASPSPSPKSKAKTRKLTKIPSIPLLLRLGNDSKGG